MAVDWKNYDALKEMVVELKRIADTLKSIDDSLNIITNKI